MKGGRMPVEKPSELYGKPWSEREYVIVLHYYFMHRESPRHIHCDYIKEAAHLIGRTAGSVVMRMENFASLDPAVTSQRKGLANVGPWCKKVFADWHQRPDYLKVCAELLIRDSNAGRGLSLFEPERVTLPRAFGRYELLDHIGDGGFGSVFSCLNTESNTQYAIKIIKADNRFGSEALHRFLREIRILAAVDPRHIIKLRESNLEDGKLFPAFVMDLAECSLSSFMQQAQLSDQTTRPCIDSATASSILLAVAQAIEALHAAKAIHRDVNPNNILLLSDGRWVLADFGLAKFMPAMATATTFVTATHPGWGTAYFTAPEQYKDFKRTDERTDVYSLGMLMWELFSSAWPPPESHVPSLPEALAPIFA